jgi:hypothetical protein
MSSDVDVDIAQTAAPAASQPLTGFGQLLPANDSEDAGGLTP